MSSKYGKQWDTVFVYDESSPSGLVWKTDRTIGVKKNGVLKEAGSPVGGVNIDGYWATGTSAFGPRRGLLIHKIVYEMFHGPVEWSSDLVIDHIDGCKTNNRIENLRLASVQVNNQNHKMHKDNTSGVIGVSRETKVLSDGSLSVAWRAFCTGLDGKAIRKSFSESVYGDRAFDMACEERARMIDTLNAHGAEYSDRHGKVDNNQEQVQ